MSVSGIGGAGAASGFYPAAGSTSGSSSVSPSSPAEEFLKYARMSPAERLRDAILKELGVTEEEIENMPAAQREAIEKQIAEKIKDKLEEASEKQTGMIVDMSA